MEAARATQHSPCMQTLQSIAPNFHDVALDESCWALVRLFFFCFFFQKRRWCSFLDYLYERYILWFTIYQNHHLVDLIIHDMTRSMELNSECAETPPILPSLWSFYLVMTILSYVIKPVQLLDNVPCANFPSHAQRHFIIFWHSRGIKSSTFLSL